MKKSLLFVTTVLAFSQAMASAKSEKIVCNFTEPFIQTVYNTSTKTLLIKDIVTRENSVIRDVSLKVNRFTKKVKLVHANGYVVQELQKTGRGSDGSSGDLYTYSVAWNGYNPEHAIIGGCEVQK